MVPGFDHLSAFPVFHCGIQSDFHFLEFPFFDGTGLVGRKCFEILGNSIDDGSGRRVKGFPIVDSRDQKIILP